MLKRLALIASALMVAALFVRTVDGATKSDWLTYVRGADAVLAGKTPYAPFEVQGPFQLPEAADGLGYVYPPSSAVVLAPFLRPFELWAALSLALFLGGALATLWVHRRLAAGPIAGVLVFTALWAPLWDGVSSGTFSVAAAGLLGLGYAGFSTAGVGAAVKLFPASWILLTRKRRDLAWSALGLGVPILVSVVLAGIEPWSEYVQVFRNATPDCARFLPSATCLGVPAPVTYGAGVVALLLAAKAPREWKLLLLGAFPAVIAPQLPLHYLAMTAPGLVAVCIRAASLLRPSSEDVGEAPRAGSESVGDRPAEVQDRPGAPRGLAPS